MKRLFTRFHFHLKFLKTLLFFIMDANGNVGRRISNEISSSSSPTKKNERGLKRACCFEYRQCCSKNARSLF